VYFVRDNVSEILFAIQKSSQVKSHLFI